MCAIRSKKKHFLLITYKNVDKQTQPSRTITVAEDPHRSGEDSSQTLFTYGNAHAEHHKSSPAHNSLFYCVRFCRLSPTPVVCVECDQGV